MGLLTLVPFVATNLPFLSNQINLGGSTLAVGDGTTGSVTGNVPQGDGSVCIYDGTTVKYSSFGIDTNLPTGGTHRVILDGSFSEIANAGTQSLSAGDQLKILFMNGSETDSNYYSDVVDYTVECKPTVTLAQELYQNGTVTVQFFNEEGDVIDATLVNETVTNGDIVALKTELKGTFERGHPYGGVIVYQYPKGYIDDVLLRDLGAGYDGIANKVPTPSFYTPLNGTQGTLTYKFPPIIGTQILTGTTVIDVDDTNNPDAVPSTAINTTIYFYAYSVNEKTGTIDLVLEDEQGTQVKKYSVSEAITLD